MIHIHPHTRTNRDRCRSREDVVVGELQVFPRRPQRNLKCEKGAKLKIKIKSWNRITEYRLEYIKFKRKRRLTWNGTLITIVPWRSWRIGRQCSWRSCWLWKSHGRIRRVESSILVTIAFFLAHSCSHLRRQTLDLRSSFFLFQPFRDPLPLFPESSYKRTLHTK